jgi:hypothetical protein
MKHLLIISLASLSIACTQYHGPAGDYNTFGKSYMKECKEMVWPDGIGQGKEAIGFDCKEYASSGISGEAAGIFEAFINQIPGLPALISWANGGSK